MSVIIIKVFIYVQRQVQPRGCSPSQSGQLSFAREPPQINGEVTRRLLFLVVIAHVRISESTYADPA